MCAFFLLGDHCGNDEKDCQKRSVTSGHKTSEGRSNEKKIGKENVSIMLTTFEVLESSSRRNFKFELFQ